MLPPFTTAAVKTFYREFLIEPTLFII